MTCGDCAVLHPVHSEGAAWIAPRRSRGEAGPATEPFERGLTEDELGSERRSDGETAWVPSALTVARFAVESVTAFESDQ
jgi:hypothetical protein